MEVLEFAGHPFFMGVQYHPELLSRPGRPSPPFFGLLLAASGQLADWESGGELAEQFDIEDPWEIPVRRRRPNHFTIEEGY
jgi:CTP synthase